MDTRVKHEYDTLNKSFLHICMKAKDEGKKKTVKTKARPARKSKFLVYIDNEEYSKVALRFACARAAKTGRQVEMLYVLEPADFVGLTGVEDRMRQEKREKAEEVLHRLAGEANDFAGLTPSLIVKEGAPEEQIIAALNDDKTIGTLIIGTSADNKAGNKMLSWLVSHAGGKLHVPIMIVPGDLSKQRIMELV